MQWLMPVAMILGALAVLYGIGASCSLAMRGLRLLLSGHHGLAARCAAYVTLIVGAGWLFAHLVWGDRSAAWPFMPQDIPLYVAYLAICHCLANVLPKRWLTPTLDRK